MCAQEKMLPSHSFLHICQ